MAARKTGTRGGSKRLKATKRVSARKSAKSKVSKVNARVKARVKKTVASAKRKTKSPLQRITGVAAQVAHQAQTAVTEGMGALREMGENIKERVSA